MNRLPLAALLPLLFVGYCGLAQPVVRYRYVLNEQVGKSTPRSKPYWGMGSEFATLRTYHTPSSFSETRLFTGDDNRSHQFRQQKGIWYYQSQGHWRLFYNAATRRGGVLSRFGARDSVTFVKVVQVRGLLLHKIVLDPPGPKTLTHQAHYYFSAEKGVLLINTQLGLLVRADAFKTSLSEVEIDTL